MERTEERRRRRRRIMSPSSSPCRGGAAAIFLALCLSSSSSSAAAAAASSAPAALALPRGDRRGGGGRGGGRGEGRGRRRQFRRGGSGSGASSSSSPSSHHHRPGPFSRESVSPPLDLTELSAYADPSVLNCTDASAAGGAEAGDDRGLFSSPYVLPSARRYALGCDLTVCGPLPVTYTNDPRAVYRWMCDNVPSSSSSRSFYSAGGDGAGGEDGGGGAGAGAGAGTGTGGACYIGFDVESVPVTPWMKGGGTNYDGPATVQLSTPRSALVVHLTRWRNERRSPPISALAALLGDPSVVKVGAGIDDDAIELFRFNPALRTRSRFDMGGIGAGGGNAAGRRVGLKALTRAVLGVELRKSKRVSVSDWSVCPLTEVQISYAARDAWAGAAVMADLAERFPDRFGPEELLRGCLEDERSVEELDDRARRRRAARDQLKEISLQYQEYGAEGADRRARNRLREEMPRMIREEVDRLQAEMDEMRPDGPVVFETEDLGIVFGRNQG